MKEFLKNKTILITGGTGFLGRSLSRAILKYGPKSLRIFSRDEVKHHAFSQEIADPRIRHLIGDVRDYDRLDWAAKDCDLIIHAAALKRLDTIEYNVDEAIKTDVLGVLNVVRVSLKNNVGKVIFVSTDKACSPINTYGSCKFLGERIISESNFNKGSFRTIFSCVRYGNVINSTGSAIPFFLEKIKKNEEIPLTNKEMTRFLITEDEAIQLIFDSIQYSVGGEILVPKLPSFKILDLINALIKGHKSKSKITIIGIRPGEKMHESMINSFEAPRTFEFKGRFVITNPLVKKYVGSGFEYLKHAKKVKFKEYNSQQHLLIGKDLQHYLKKTNLIPNS